MSPILAGMRRRAGLWRVRRRRRRLAETRLRGRGLEIGALHDPLPLPRGATATYVDRYDVAGLRQHYPELSDEVLVAPDIVDDVTRLPSIPDRSQDFVIANHVLEHLEDPLTAITTLVRVLRPGGVLFAALPLPSGVDARRPVTPLAHVVEDHRDAGARSRAGHYLEWARLVDVPLGSVAVEDAERHAADLEARAYSIHFHVWAPSDFSEVLQYARDELATPLGPERVEENGHEYIVLAARVA